MKLPPPSLSDTDNELQDRCRHPDSSDGDLEDFMCAAVQWCYGYKL
jgi:hypothetical protein